MNSLGNGWTCKWGYSRSGDQCLKVSLPENAQVNSLGNGWTCKWGYSRSGDQCLGCPYRRTPK